MEWLANIPTAVWTFLGGVMASALAIIPALKRITAVDTKTVKAEAERVVTEQLVTVNQLLAECRERDKVQQEEILGLHKELVEQQREIAVLRTKLVAVEQRIQ